MSLTEHNLNSREIVKNLIQKSNPQTTQPKIKPLSIKSTQSIEIVNFMPDPPDTTPPSLDSTTYLHKTHSTPPHAQLKVTQPPSSQTNQQSTTKQTNQYLTQSLSKRRNHSKVIDLALKRTAKNISVRSDHL